MASQHHAQTDCSVRHRDDDQDSRVAYNGLITNPLFTGVPSTELMKDPEERARNLRANLIGGAIGFLIFTSLRSIGIENYRDLAPKGPIAPIDVIVVVVFVLPCGSQSSSAPRPPIR